MQKSYSFQELPRLLNNCVQPASVLVSLTANTISHIMKSTKGKEKLLAFVQYSMELFKITNSHFITSNKLEYPLYLKNISKIEKSMRNGRKLMRLLMFLDEIHSLERLWKSQAPRDVLFFLQSLSYLSGSVFYILDNLVWCSDIGIINQTIYRLNIKWKNTKDIAACSKSILSIIISIIVTIRTKRKIEELKYHSEKNAFFVEELLSARRQLRLRGLDVIVNVLRFFMLCKSLRLPGSNRLSKEFSAVCGILSSSFSLFAMLVGEEILKVETGNKLRMPGRAKSTVNSASSQQT